MSIIFKPKIAAWFGDRKEPVKSVVKKVSGRPHKYWVSSELQKVVDLRALGVSLSDTAKILNRGHTSVSAAIVHHDLYEKIAEKRAMHITGVTDA
jgi:hypothetical protein